MERQFSPSKNVRGSTLGTPTEWIESSSPSFVTCPEMLMVRYIHASDLSDKFDSGPLHTLAIISHDRGPSVPEIGKCLNISVNLPQKISPPVLEIWQSSAPVLCDQVHGIHLAFSDETVFGCLEVEESSESVLEDVVRSAYEQIFEYCSNSGFSHLLRMWNYFPNINEDSNGLERYRRFCVGRHQAFSTCHKDFASILPAASAVGTQSGPLQILFLAGKQPGKPLENPRQISAYDYPPIYGPKSPSFARATLHRTSGGDQLFVAGTASIFGHATQHHGDPAKQTLETLSNISAILNRARPESQKLLRPISAEGLLKVFVRHQEDLPIVREVLENHEYGKGPILYVLGEMCRKELLVEIEGIWNLWIEAND